MALMHGVLLPINCVRLVEMTRLTQRVHARHAQRRPVGALAPALHEAEPQEGGRASCSARATTPSTSISWSRGRVEFPENGASIGPGEMFGEIAFFSPERQAHS